MQGFSSANLWRMRNFYIAYQKNEKLAPMVREISWTKNIIILERCKDDILREFYIKVTKKFGWTKDVLTNQLAIERMKKDFQGWSENDGVCEPCLERYRAKAA